MNDGLFGYFDFRHLGVTIYFDKGEDFDIFRDQTKNDFSMLSDQERFRTLLIKSAFHHELRHFHDFLLTSYGYELFFLWNMILNKGVYIFNDILGYSETASTHIIIPFNRWDRMTIEEKNAYLLKNKLDRKHTFNCLTFNEDSHNKKDNPIEEVRKAYDRINEILNGNSEYDFNFEGHSFKNQDVFELSAFLSQMQYIYQQYGTKEQQFFTDYILKIDPNNCPLYFLLFRLFANILLEKEGIISIPVMSDVVMWSLLADKFSYNEEPRARFLLLVTNIKNKGVAWFGSNTRERFSQWSKLLGMKDFHQYYGERHNALLIYSNEKALTEPPVQNTFIRSVVGKINSVANKFNKASLQALVDFHGNMEAYTDLSIYVEKTEMPMPYFDYQFNNFVIDEVTRKTNEDRLLYYRPVGNDVYQVHLLEAALNLPNPPLFDKDEFTTYKNNSEIIDYLFSGPQSTSFVAQQDIIKKLKENNITIHIIME